MNNVSENFPEGAEETPDRLAAFLNRPLAVGNKKIEKRLLLAPLSKLGNVAFRELVAGFGGYGLLFSEMAGSRAIPCGRGHHKSGFMWRDEELSSLVCQVYGDDPEDMAVAARRVEAEGFFGVDLNFGCSVSSVCKHNCGAALLKDPPLAEKIVAAVRKAISIPLFIKFRTGWKDDPLFAVEMARRFEDAGADALTFHPRVAPDLRTRLPKWEYVARVKAAVSVPVFGNGNVFDRADCEKMIQTTGCDGVAIGRLAVAKPWTFAEWTDAFRPEPAVYGQSALKYLALLLSHFEPSVALRRYYKFSGYYASNFRFGHTFFSMVHKAKTPDALEATLSRFFETPPDLMSRPNITMLR
ncbi:dihydrouridine synthase [Desulfonema ishimotonii]|uniref:tRNA-dihydrouridine synthase n=1 Tax=Desulfonema ishimotonii TaxID=45657 RepID=A0A401FUX7_9BACT|nr:tRNA-dihydrouridine synthase family protein [Desulfonema ishimotonii]GBC60753.1 dihydrouridine synthase [Desulfonema ishimotonii]